MTERPGHQASEPRCRGSGRSFWVRNNHKPGWSARFPSRFTVHTVFTVFFAVTYVDNLFKL